MNSKPELQLILPLFNEEAHILEIVNRIDSSLSNKVATFEYLFVDDGSSDDSWKIIQELSRNNSRVHGIRFNRNFGKESAILAGLKESTAEAVIILDADLQHPPELITEMYDQWKNEGVKIVEACAANKKRDTIVHQIGAFFTYTLLEFASGTPFQEGTDFKLLDREIVDCICQLPEKNRFFRGLVSWTGAPSKTIEFTPKERAAGASKWTLKQLASFSLDALTSHTTAPLRLITFFSMLFILFSLLLSAQTLYQYLSGNAVEGFTTVIISILLVGGVLSAALGIIGEYIARIHEELKSRPSYLIKERV